MWGVFLFGYFGAKVVVKQRALGGHATCGYFLDKQNKASRLRAKKYLFKFKMDSRFRENDGVEFYHFTLSLALSHQGRGDMTVGMTEVV